MRRALRRLRLLKRKPVTQAELEKRLWACAVALGIKFGRRNAWRALTHMANILAIPDSDQAVTMDIMHMEDTL